jgi:hypothetical protein
MEESQSLIDRIMRFSYILKDTELDEDDGFPGLKPPEELFNEFRSLLISIQQDLIDDPGKLIYVEDDKKRELLKSVVNIVWLFLDESQLWDENADVSLNYHEHWMLIKSTYIDRAPKLKPTFISVNPSGTEFKCYYDEAMQAWLYGLDTSALILCCSIIEHTLYKDLWYKHQQGGIDLSPLFSLDMDGNKPDVNPRLWKMINKAEELGIIDFKEKEKAHQVKDLRNLAVHDLKAIGYKRAYKAILDTKDLIESILSKSETY